METFKRKPHRPDVAEYFREIRNGNRIFLGRAITLIESKKPEHQALAQELIELCLPFSGNSIRIGITGVPGAGKSTFIESFGTYLTNQDKKVAVLAVDPSSNISKGSILGDKTRMNELAVNPKAFIRPSPAAGSLGGVAKATRETTILCEAAGYEIIIIETVGVGQSETAVHSMVDFFLLLMIAGAGDELQGIKRGIMEMADAIAINKADGDNVKKAMAARTEFAHAIHLFPPPDWGWIPKVETCSALTSKGIENIWQIIESHHNMSVQKGFFIQNRANQSEYWMKETIQESLKTAFLNHPQVKQLLPELTNSVKSGKISSYKAADELLKAFNIYR
jgi:LAO/AO transport system kinase